MLLQGILIQAQRVDIFLSPLPKLATAIMMDERILHLATAVAMAMTAWARNAGIRAVLSLRGFSVSKGEECSSAAEDGPLGSSVISRAPREASPRSNPFSAGNLFQVLGLTRTQCATGRRAYDGHGRMPHTAFSATSSRPRALPRAPAPCSGHGRCDEGGRPALAEPSQPPFPAVSSTCSSSPSAPPCRPTPREGQ